MFNLKFKYPPGIKLYAELGIKRPATDKELEKLHHRLRFFKIFKKGYSSLWDSMTQVREITVLKAEFIHFGPMTQHFKEMR